MISSRVSSFWPLAALASVATFALAFATAPAFATPHLASGVDDDISIWRVVAGLVICVGLAVAGAFVLRARNGVTGTMLRARTRRLQVVEVARIGRQVDLCIVNCDGREWILATSPHGAVVVSHPPPDMPPQPPS